jgi:DNA-directed RNA polymerase subunit M/transcription elongation factor TFIIS
MKFCKLCENMLYALEDGDAGSVQFKCRKCEYSEPITRENPIVYEHNLKEDMAARLVVNPYLTEDPTLPRFETITCPNGHTGNVVGVKVDTQNVVWMYQCGECKTTWKQASRRA